MVQRIRGRALQALRARIFKDNPLCVMCAKAGRVTVATELDHIVALVNGGQNEDANLQGLCKACHEDKTRTDLGYRQVARFDAGGHVVW